MPKYERYPNEAPGAARRRIARNRAANRGNPGNTPGRNRAIPPQPGMTPRTAGDTGSPKPPAPFKPPRPPRVPRTKGSFMKKGYNFTKNLGDTPDIGY